MNRSALAFVFCLLVAPISFAQEPASAAVNSPDAPASHADVERYLDAMHTREMMHSMMDKMSTQMRQMVRDMLAKESNLPPDAEARLDKMLDEDIKDLPLDEMLDVMIPVYQKHFTRGDIDALIAFYSTPIGQKVIKELPAITAESLQAASGIIQKAAAKAMQRAQDEVAEMQKEYENSHKSQSQMQN
jgi:uncharacterized protein